MYIERSLQRGYKIEDIKISNMKCAAHKNDAHIYSKADQTFLCLQCLESHNSNTKDNSSESNEVIY